MKPRGLRSDHCSSTWSIWKILSMACRPTSLSAIGTPGVTEQTEDCPIRLKHSVVKYHEIFFAAFTIFNLRKLSGRLP